MTHRLVKLAKRTWANFAYKEEISLELSHPLVSFTFDDVPASGFENGGEILARYDFAGTFYISLHFLNADDPEESYTLQHLTRAVANRHELACHTHGHIEFNRTPIRTSIHDLKKNRRGVQALLPEVNLVNFSYPYGAQTLAVKKHLGRTYRSARGIEQGINASKGDRYNLKAIQLYEAQFALEEIFKKLDEVEKCNGWLIFYTHDVRKDPTPWGCSPAYFEAVVKETADRNLRVSTINNALDLIEANQ